MCSYKYLCTWLASYTYLLSFHKLSSQLCIVIMVGERKLRLINRSYLFEITNFDCDANY